MTENAETEMQGAVETDPQAANNQPDPEVSVEGLMGDAHSEGREAKTEAKPDFEPDPAKGERPESIPEQFWDKDKGEIKTEALAKSYADLRKEFNKQKGGKKEDKALETSEEYLKDYEVPKEYETEDGVKSLDRIRDIGSDDPVIVSFSKAAHKFGLSKDQFNGIVGEVLSGANDMLPEPFNRDAEMEALGGEDKALPLIQTNQKWLLHKHKNGVLNEDQYKYALEFGTTAIGVETLNKLRVDSGEKPIPMGASVNTGIKTPDEAAAMMSDPRYKEDSPAGNAYRAEVEKEFKKIHGET